MTDAYSPYADKGDQVTCEVCATRFTASRSASDTMDEALDLWRAQDLADGMGTVCDDCFTKILAWARENMPEAFRSTP